MITLLRNLTMLFHYGTCHKEIAALKHQIGKLESDNALLRISRSDLQDFACTLEGRYKQSQSAYEEKIKILESKIRELESMVPIVDQSERAIESELAIIKKSNKKKKE